MQLSPTTLSFALAAATCCGGLSAQKAQVTVVHGIPGLPAAVDVFANGSKLFDFEFGEVKGPLALDPGTYNLEVKLRGQTVLTLSPTVAADTSYTVVAHLKAGSGNALSAFVNDTSAVDRGESRVIVRHLANAPAVDVIAQRFFSRTRLFENVTNGQEGKVDVRSGTYYVSLNAAGTRTRAFGPVRLRLESGKIYAIHAVGDLAKETLRFIPQVIGVRSTARLTTQIRGRACGGKIGVSKTTFGFGDEFDVTLSGATNNGFGFLHAGPSDSRFLAFRLPLDLGILGASGCSLYQNTPSIRPIRTDAMGASKQTLKIPASAAARFNELHFQYSFLAPGKNRLGLQLTDYLTVEKQ